MTNSKTTPPEEPSWVNGSDEKLLEMRICDLHVSIKGTDLETRIQSFYKELERKNISFKPICYLGDEWFCPEGSCTIAIPFFLAHPRLKKLEERMMMEVEGDTREWCLQLLRHEMGHVIFHSYLLGKRKKWKKLFGSPNLEYSETYRAMPYSKRYVKHLDDWYAQSHPEEDFSETFAIWLTPGLDWKHQYKNWKALEKLEYVDDLMKELSGKPQLVNSQTKTYEASRLRSRLGKYYQRRRRTYAQDLPDFFDSDLKHLFFEAEKNPSLKEKASTFLSHHRKVILNAVSRWTGEPKFTINRLMKSLSTRSKELDLRVGSDKEKSALEITAYLAALASNYRHTGKFKKS